MAVAEAGKKAAPRDVRAKFLSRRRARCEKGRAAGSGSVVARIFERRSQAHGYPHPAVAHDWLGRLFENQNRNDAARAEYETSLQLDPKNKTAQEALKRLRKN